MPERLLRMRQGHRLLRARPFESLLLSFLWTAVIAENLEQNLVTLSALDTALADDRSLSGCVQLLCPRLLSAIEKFM